jgi:hypothetical protein
MQQEGGTGETNFGFVVLSMTPSRLPAFLLHFLVVTAACGKSASSAAPGVSSGESKSAPSAVVEAGAPAIDPVALDLWTRAKDNVATGDGDDLARLADRENLSGLLARAEDPAWRATAIHAMAYVDGFEALPWLAKVARAAPNEDALAALDAIEDIAARPRRAVDPEDAAEMKSGCDSLLALAKQSDAARARRIIAIRALRMLSERGCVAPAEIPADLDAH